jgi:hypothetical protein
MGLALLALSVAGPLQAQPLSAQGVVNRCAGVSTALTGLSALRKACPGLEAALDQLGLTAQLPSGWSKTLSAGGLADLRALLQRYSGSPPSQPPRAATLRFIAAALIPPTPPPTWWDRVREWIQQRADALFEWLRSLHPSAAHSRLAKIGFYAFMVLLLALVAIVLGLELRGAGLIRARRRAPPRGGAGVSFGAAPLEAKSADADWTRLRDQPARILRLLVEALTRAHRLEHDRHLTCRELEAQARLDTEIERQGFVRVARLAERELYGPPGGTVLPEDTLREMRTLHARLLAAGGQAEEIRR